MLEKSLSWSIGPRDFAPEYAEFHRSPAKGSCLSRIGPVHRRMLELGPEERFARSLRRGRPLVSVHDLLAFSL